MAGFLTAELVGRLGQQAKWHERESRYLTFSVAHNTTPSRNGIPAEVIWISCIWFDAPTKITEYLQPGTEVFVRGKLSARTYRTSQEDIKVSLDITVSELKILHAAARKSEDTPATAETSEPSATPETPSAMPAQEQDKTFYKDF